MIKDLCFKLAKKRKDDNISLEQVVEKTKLCPSVIRSIEEGNLGRISSTYLKGFIKIYAACLNVDIEQQVWEELASFSSTRSGRDTAKELNQRVSRQGKEESVEKNTEFVPKKEATVVRKNLCPRLSLFGRRNIILFLLTFLFIFITFNVIKFIVVQVAAGIRAISVDGAPAVMEEKDSTSAAVFPVVDVYDREIEAVLQIERDCFVRVIVDDKLLFEGILNKGVVETWQGSKEIEFKISDGSAVRLEVNGKSYPPLTSMRKPIKSLKITHKGIEVEK